MWYKVGKFKLIDKNKDLNITEAWLKTLISHKNSKPHTDTVIFAPLTNVNNVHKQRRSIDAGSLKKVMIFRKAKYLHDVCLLNV